jgi:hypothetical protein
MTDADTRGRHAAFARRPHLADESAILLAWFTEPAGVVIQLAEPSELTMEMTRWLVGPGLEALVQRFPGDTPLTIVLDVRLMTSRQPAVRGLIVEAAKALRARLARAVVIPPQNATRVYLAGLNAAVAVLRVFGVDIELQDSLKIALARIGLHAAA